MPHFYKLHLPDMLHLLIMPKPIVVTNNNNPTLAKAQQMAT